MTPRPEGNTTKRLSVLATLALALGPATARAADISTHVLDLARGIGGRDVSVVLLRTSDDGRWVEFARTRTDENGRVRSFGAAARFEPGIYKLQFDMTGYPAPGTAPFFPEIDLVFRMTDTVGHYHVPVVVSPYGYSTYRGN